MEDDKPEKTIRLTASTDRINTQRLTLMAFSKWMSVAYKSACAKARVLKPLLPLRFSSNRLEKVF